MRLKKKKLLAESQSVFKYIFLMLMKKSFKRKNKRAICWELAVESLGRPDKETSGEEPGNVAGASPRALEREALLSLSIGASAVPSSLQPLLPGLPCPTTLD